MADERDELLARIATLESKLDRMEARRAALRARIRAINPWLRTAIVTTVLAIPLAAYASSVTVPNVFVNGTVADANEVNANFAAVEVAVNDNDARIASIEAIGADITDVLAGTGLAGGGTSGSIVLGVDPVVVQSRVSGTCPPGSSIRTIASNGTVGCEIDSIGSGDITGVNAGTGLTGGGSSGTVTVSVAPSGITSGLIADGSVGPNDINQAASYTINGLTNNGSTNLNGALTIVSGADIRIQDNFNGFRWYDTAGTTQFGAILMRSTEASFFDANNSRYAVHSDADGVGIGTTLTATGYDVSVPSLSVSGQLSVGLERVSNTYTLSSMSASCHSHGNLACYYGFGSVTCPVGKRLLGGGSTGSSGLFGSIAQSYPSSNTTWSCGASYDIANSTRTCYALCGRVE